MAKNVLKILVILTLMANQAYSQGEKLDRILGERIDGPANIRDTINGKILFSLNDNTLVECTENITNWHIVGLFVKLDSTQFENFKLTKGDILFDANDDSIGVAINDIPLWLSDDNEGFIAGYTYKDNIKQETIIENTIMQLVIDKNYNLSTDDLKQLIYGFKMETCSATSMADENGEWYFYYDNVIDDISPRDRITLILENEKLIGIVHSHNLNLRQSKTYELIRGHKFTPIGNVPESKINEIINERINWYNSVD